MGLFDRIFGGDDGTQQDAQPRPHRTEDDIAVERYQYLLRTAPPETIEQVHTEAFAKLTPEQRDLLFEQLKRNPIEGERPVDNEPGTLARAATRSEMQSPGFMQRAFSNQGGQNPGGPSFGSMVGSSLLGTVAGYVIGSAIVSAFIPDSFGNSEAGGDAGSEAGADSGADAGTDSGASADGGGFDGGGFGGDFGGGDFGGDFGGF